MSEITVKQLAQIVSTPVEIMLKQMQDADIPVSSPDDSITDEQKLKLLAFIRAGQQPMKPAAPAPANKLSMGGKADRKAPATPTGKANVAVRHKKRTVRRPEAVATTSSEATVTNRAEELARRGAAEREALNKARGIETKQPSEEAVEPVVEEVKAPVKVETVAVVETPKVIEESKPTKPEVKAVEKTEKEPAPVKDDAKPKIEKVAETKAPQAKASQAKPTPEKATKTPEPEVAKVAKVEKTVTDTDTYEKNYITCSFNCCYSYNCFC